MTQLHDTDPVRLLSDLDFVRSLARGLCRDPELADDLAQETMLRALERAPAAARNRRGWLATVARNLLRNRNRDDARRRRREERAANDRSVPTPAEVAEREQLRRVVVDATMQLPEPLRAVVLLRHYRSLDTRATAAELGIPEATVRTRLKRGLDQLRTRLDREHGGDRDKWVTALLPLAWPDRATAAVGVGMTGGAQVVLAAMLLVGLALVAWAVTVGGEQTPPPAIGGGAAPVEDATVDDASSREPVAADTTDRQQPVRSTAPTGRAPATLYGRVVAGTFPGEPVPNARVRAAVDLVDARGFATIPLGEVTTDASGAFGLSLAAIRGFEPGRLRRLAVFLDIDADGYTPVHDEPTRLLRWDGRSTIDADPVIVQPKALAKGVVVDRDGAPIRDAIVWTEHDGELLGISRSQRDGTFAAPAGAVGTTQPVFATHPEHGYSRVVRIRRNPEGDTHAGTLVVDRAMAQITGRVTLPDGTPVADVEVRVESTVSTTERPAAASLFVDGIDIGMRCAHGDATVDTDADGRFAFRSLAAVAYRVVCRRAAREPASSTEHGPDWRHFDEVVRAELAPTPIELVVPQRLFLGKVLDRWGYPLEHPRWARYVWAGDEAEQARSALAREGCTAALLRTGVRYSHRQDVSLDAQGAQLVVIEVATREDGFYHGSWWFAPGQCAAEGDVRPPTIARPRGDVQLRTPGHPDTEVHFKVCRVYAEHAVPLPWSYGGRRHPPSKVMGDWHRVPDSGLITDLPAGELTFELRIGDGDTTRVETLLVPPDRTTQLVLN